MNIRWIQVKRYTVSGWKSTSLSAVLLFLLVIAILSFLSPAPFWFVFPSLTPILFLYLFLVGFLLDRMEQDWKDWHLW